MGVGHLAAALVLKRAEPKINLGWLFFGALLSDFLLGVFYWMGLEASLYPIGFRSSSLPHIQFSLFSRAAGQSALVGTGVFASKILLAGRQRYMGRHRLGSSRLFAFHLRFHGSRAGAAPPWKRLKEAGAWFMESHGHGVGSGIDISRGGDLLVSALDQEPRSAREIGTPDLDGRVLGFDVGRNDIFCPARSHRGGCVLDSSSAVAERHCILARSSEQSLAFPY